MSKEVQSMPRSPESIRAMFDLLANGYDRFNRLSSLGLDALWRKKALEPIRPGMRVLDIGCGTGDLALGALERIQGRGEVVGLDFSEPMLKRAEEKRRKNGPAGPIRWELRGAEEIPFESAPFDAAVSGFVLRNLRGIEGILAGVYRALRPGGILSFVDLTEPENPLVRRGGFVYLNTGVDIFGRLVFGADYPRDYLKESMKSFLRPRAFKELLQKTGFTDVTAKSFLLGMVTLYSARKPETNV